MLNNGLPFFLNICSSIGGIPENKDSELGSCISIKWNK